MAGKMFEKLDKLKKQTRQFFEYILDTHSPDHEIKHGRYVYILYDEKRKSGEEIVYVGQTHEPFSRIVGHQRDKEFTHFTYYKVPKDVDVNALERALIKWYRPFWNKTHNHRKKKSYEIANRQIVVFNEAFESRYAPVRQELLNVMRDFRILTQKYRELLNK